MKIWSVKYYLVSIWLIWLLSFGEAFGQLTLSAQTSSASACQNSSTSLFFKVGKGTGCSNLSTANVNFTWQYSSNGTTWNALTNSTPTGFSYAPPSLSSTGSG